VSVPPAPAVSPPRRSDQKHRCVGPAAPPLEGPDHDVHPLPRQRRLLALVTVSGRCRCGTACGRGN